MVVTNAPVPAGYRVWLVEQDLARLTGEYLTEAMVIAPTEREALDAVCSLADPVRGFGLTVRRSRLRAVDYGPAPEPLPVVPARHRHGDAQVLVVGTGTDDDRPPAESDDHEV